MLLNLQEWIWNDSATDANVIAIYDYLTNEQNNLEIDDIQKQEIGNLVNDLSNASVVSAMWGTEYDKAKAEILSILPSNLKTSVALMFSDFEIIQTDIENWMSQQDLRKEKLQDILTLIKWKSTENSETQKDDEIAKSDLDRIVVPNMCRIMYYYEIPSNSNLCWDIEVIQIPEVSDVEQPRASKGKLKTWLKVLIISLSSLIWVFILLVIFFAVKAKIGRSKEDEE